MLIQNDSTIIHLWQEILQIAISQRATDIHIEAHQLSTLIRFRIDGDLVTHKKISASSHDHLIAHIKVSSKLDIAEKRLPQDGRFSFITELNHSHKTNVDCRVSTLPMIYGEKIVVRLLPHSDENLHISNLGFDDWQLKAIQSLLEFPQGLILITGPTGSGKTLTLYSLLKSLNNGSRNISTVEDPAEIKLAGINQVSINEKVGLDFPKALRALLRQDPDIIMIGEIRDECTAKIALQAAQTGHLVLGTLHTNSCIATLSRLNNLGCNTDLLASSLLGITAQRLIRKRCTKCIVSLSSNCSFCAGLGFRGRLAVHEVMPFYPKMRQMLNTSYHPCDLLTLAKSYGMRELFENASHLVSLGVTTQKEIESKIGATL